MCNVCSVHKKHWQHNLSQQCLSESFWHMDARKTLQDTHMFSWGIAKYVDLKRVIHKMHSHVRSRNDTHYQEVKIFMVVSWIFRGQGPTLRLALLPGASSTVKKTVSGKFMAYSKSPKRQVNREIGLSRFRQRERDRRRWRHHRMCWRHRFPHSSGLRRSRHPR